MTTLEIILICITIHLVGGWIFMFILSKDTIIEWEELLTGLIWEFTPIIYICNKIIIEKRYKNKKSIDKKIKI